MVCEGCLSDDRILLKADKEISEVYFNILDTEFGDNEVQLCWECTALLKRFLKFKQQVKCAHTVLVKYLVPQSKSLSNLKTTECNNIIQIDPDAQVLLTTFVKVEDGSHTDSIDCCTDDLVDQEFGDDEQVVDDGFGKFTNKEQGESNDKSDHILERPELVDKSRRQSSASEVFNDSDNEPLKVCKGDKAKPREKRKKKNEGDQKARRREKAPGVVNNARVQSKLKRLNVDAELLEMVVLSWDEVEEERRAALASPAFLRHEHRCYTCVVGFNHRCKLEHHNAKKHDPSLGVEECGVCHVRLATIFALRAHRRRHVTRWRCRVCGAAWSRAEVAADHAARAHGARAPTHVCHVCGRHETSLGRLRNHVSTHSEKQKCELCGKLFCSKESLRTHLFIHKGEKEHACPRCDKKFLFKKAMELHCISHDASSQLYCYECDVNFKNQMSFNQHMKYSLKHVDPAKLKHVCTLCDKRFVKAVRLEEHNLAVHLKMTPISCTEPGCTFACSSKPVLRTHIRMLHRNARAKRDHVCEICGKAYSTKKSLEGHLRTHSGERPYRCAACPAAFGYQAALYNHNKLVHLKQKIGRGRTTASE